nr:MAG TPA: hypothetical protein [Caudoviricetes sp.]
MLCNTPISGYKAKPISFFFGVNILKKILIHSNPSLS